MLVERKEILNEDKTIGYIESVFKSDNILNTTYFPNNQRLYIAFSRGHTYSYGNISPEFYQEFEDAESHGKFFYKNINKKTEYPYRKEFTLYPTEVNELKDIVKNNTPEEDE
ncbi:MAG: KTSC domain-containing protein [Bacteroidales bacterium]|jgi:hypothetical protein|nr:KTSC domain-containing protein [Bacteroidales bacterium]